MTLIYPLVTEMLGKSTYAFFPDEKETFRANSCSLKLNLIDY